VSRAYLSGPPGTIPGAPRVADILVSRSTFGAVHGASTPRCGSMLGRGDDALASPSCGVRRSVPTPRAAAWGPRASGSARHRGVRVLQLTARRDAARGAARRWLAGLGRERRGTTSASRARGGGAARHRLDGHGGGAPPASVLCDDVRARGYALPGLRIVGCAWPRPGSLRAGGGSALVSRRAARRGEKRGGVGLALASPSCGVWSAPLGSTAE